MFRDYANRRRGQWSQINLIGPVLLVASCLIAFGNISAPQAAPVVIPGGVMPGDSYRLAFVTSGARDALSGDIDDYNAFVTLAANAVPELAALGTTWRAIGSTAAIDARDNTHTNPLVDGLGVPIYSLDGVDLIAADNADLWDGALVTPIRETENGVIENNVGIAWTGSWFDGTGFAAGLLGSSDAVVGLTPFFSANWVASQVRPSSETYFVYGISGLLTAPALEMPELPLAVVLLTGIVVLRCARQMHRFRRQ